MSSLILNSTQIPNTILDEWLVHLSGSEFKVVMYVARRTYGFQKAQDSISLKQMAEGIKKKDGTYLDHGCGLSLSSIKRASKRLEGLDVLVRKRVSSKKRGDEATCWSLNLERVPKARPVGQNEPGRGPNSATQKKVRQKTTTTAHAQEEESVEPVLLDDITGKCLVELKKVKGFPRKQTENAIYLTELREEFPGVDAVEVCKQYAIWHYDNAQKTTNYRGRLRSFFKRASESLNSNVVQMPLKKSHSPSPDCVISALESYNRDGTTDLQKFASLARKWDFLSDEDPPWEILRELSPDSGERARYLDRIRSVSRRAMRSVG